MNLNEMKVKKGYTNQEVMKLRKNESAPMVVTYVSLNEITLTCPMKFKRFPFDEQYCDLNIYDLHAPPSEKFNMTTRRMKLGSHFADFYPTVRDYAYTLQPAANAGFTVNGLNKFVASAGFRLKLSRISSKYFIMYYIPMCKYSYMVL